MAAPVSGPRVCAGRADSSAFGHEMVTVASSFLNGALRELSECRVVHYAVHPNYWLQSA